MEEVAALLTAWADLGPPAEDEAAAFSIVLAANPKQKQVDALVTPLQPWGGKIDHAFASGALRTETKNRFWILTLTKLTARGAETLAFETARALRRHFKADSARPILIDSLIGETYARPAADCESYVTNQARARSGFCSTKDEGPPQRGWALTGHGFGDAWEVSKGEGVTIASIDTGYSDHRELEHVIEMEGQLNLIETDTPNDASDRFSSGNPGHGTIVASVAASRGVLNKDSSTDGDKCVTGAAPKAKILPIRATRAVVNLRQKHLPRAIQHAVGENCGVIVMALGSVFPIEPVERALDHAVKNGVIVVCAAGNCIGGVVYPAQFSKHGYATAVAAVDYLGAAWEKTSKGSAVTISAYGEEVWSAFKRDKADTTNSIDALQGTTLAAALTAGAAALWIAARGGTDALKKKAKDAGVTVQALFNEALRRSASKLPGEPWNMGAGLLNARKLVTTRISTIKTDLLPRARVPSADFTPARKLLAQAIEEVDAIAAIEAANIKEDLAVEALWRFHVKRAIRRASAAQLSVKSPTAPTAALSKELQLRPRLGELVE